MSKTGTESRLKRKKRIRKKVFGTAERPRLTVFRSAKHIYVQVVNDDSGKTLVAASTSAKGDSGTKIEGAKSTGKTVAEKCISQGLKSVVFDRNGFMYHGRIKALADAARETGLEF